MTDERNNLDHDHATEASFRPFAALAFWCSLFLAAGLFAVLALAPKVRTYHGLAREYDRLHRRLVSTERRTESLTKVADALEHDPQFAAELSRVDFDAPNGEERIPVGPQLSLAAWDSGPAVEEAVRHEPSQMLVDEPFLDMLCDDRTVRLRLMGAGSLLILAGFGLCGERGQNRDDDHSGRPGIRAWLANRYRKPVA
jgi:hypothetical protein